jgi:uroporphyrinogen decarboxylase
MKEMTSRQRVLAALSHQQPDRVPLDLGGTRNSTMVVEGYERLKAHLGVAAPSKMIERMMRVVEIDEKVCRALAIDTRGVFPDAPTRGLAADLGPNRYRDMWGVERVQPEGSYYYDLAGSPLVGDITLQDILRYPWPDPDDPGFTNGLTERARWIRGHTEAASVLALPSAFVHVSQYLRGFEDWFCDFVVDPKRLEALFDAILDVTMAIAKRQLQAVGREVDVVLTSDDLGAQNAFLVSREHYLRYIKPRQQRFFRQIKELTPAKVVFHSCGSVAAIIDDLIEMGVDGLNPVQPQAAGMNPANLKKQYRGRMAFWGGTDAQNIVPRGSVADVKRMVERLIADMGEGGGYIFSNCHNIQPDVPLENVLAMFEHAREYVPSFATR